MRYSHLNQQLRSWHNGDTKIIILNSAADQAAFLVKFEIESLITVEMF
jgi:hypothetical protein